jgi:sortase A
MHRFVRFAGLAMATVGALALVWAVVVWQWQDPFTGLYTRWQQHKLEAQLQQEFRTYAPREGAGVFVSTSGEVKAIEAAAARLRSSAGSGQAIGRIVVPRLGLNMILVNGTDDSSLERGPGRDLRSYMPGQNRLVYVAGHRTTFLAPFSQINTIRPGDPITLEMPYGTFLYRAVRHVIVRANDLSVLRSPKHELLALQACHPRFFATHRYIVYARLVDASARGAPQLSAEALAAG